MKKILRPYILSLWLSIVCTVAFASCSSSDDSSSEQQSTIERIAQRGTLLVGTTGDYRPLSYREADGTYWGFGIEMAAKIWLSGWA